MNSNNQTLRIADKPLLYYTRIAGFAYVFIILLALIPSSILDVGHMLSESDAATNMKENEWLFRIGIFSELIMFMTVMLLSWSLYVILKTVNKNLALLALIFRFGESILGCMVVLFLLIVLMFLDGTGYLKVFEAEQLQALARFFLNVYGTGYDILLAVMGVGGIIFCYLFYKSNYVPRFLAAWGIFTYFTMLIYALLKILLPNPPSEMMYVMAPGTLFEIVFGLWLFIKGVNVHQWEKRNLDYI